jgi:hypothetical protein
MIQSITSLTASDPVQFLNTSPHSLNQASQSVLRVLLPFLYQKSPVPEVLTLWGTCVHFSFLNSSINALLAAFGGAGVTVWGCFSPNCKLDLYVLDGTLTGQK